MAFDESPKESVAKQMFEESQTKRLIILILHATHYFRSARRAFDSLCKRKLNFNSGHRNVARAKFQDFVVERSDGSGSLQDDDDDDKVRNNDDLFPKPNRAATWLLNAMSIWIAFAVLRNISPLDKWSPPHELESSSNCHVPGRLVLVEPLPKVVTIIFGLYHLYWRWVQNNQHRPLAHLLVFLYQRVADLKLTESSISSAKESPEAPLEERRKDFILKHVIGYEPTEVDEGMDQVYLRPNRTVEAHGKIHRWLKRATVVILILEMPVVLLAAWVILGDIFSYESYVENYGNCTMTTSTHSTGEIWPAHRVYATAMDLCENLAYWLTVAMNVVVVGPLPCLLNYDLSLYLSHTERRIKRLKDTLEFERKFQQDKLQGQDHEEDLKLELRLRCHGYLLRKSGKQGGRLTARQIEHNLRMFSAELRREVFEVQDEVLDFFDQFDAADAYASHIIVASLCLWVTSFLVLRYLKVSMQVDFSCSFQVYQASCFLAYTLMSATLLQVHKRLQQVHKQIYRIIAICETEHKFKFMRIGDKFNERKGFSLIGKYSFVSQTYLSVLGWTFSSLIIVDNLFRPHNS